RDRDQLYTLYIHFIYQYPNPFPRQFPMRLKKGSFLFGLHFVFKERDFKICESGRMQAIEGKSGQANTTCGFDRIKTRLKDASESRIACIFQVLNMANLAGVAPLCRLSNRLKMFLSKCTVKILNGIH
ncbi:MAG: hypothetical protein Q8908_11200, partial [Bacteroidota bacterium]|nr:hypothetical protein [Bacteroidota bacterium]